MHIDRFKYCRYDGNGLSASGAPFVAVVDWHWETEDSRILFVKILPPVRWEDLEALQREMEDAPYPDRWAVLVDFSEAGRIPQISVSHVARMLYNTPHGGACAFAITGVGGFLHAMIPLLARLYPSVAARFKLADSEEQARVWLLERLGPAE